MILRGYLLETSMIALAVALGSFATGCGSDPSPTSSDAAGSGTGSSGAAGGGQSSSASGGQGGSGGGSGQGGSGQGGAGGGSCIPETEICDGADNNCDGVVDEGCICMPGSTQECYTGPAGAKGVGVCVAGTQTCDTSGQWGSCTGDVLPENETCDGLDNDCDGTTDDGNPGGGIVCDTGNPGPCAAGTTACSNGSIVCKQDVQPSPEACDGADNNCDGATDEGNPGGGVVCTTGNPGPCATGTTACSNGSVVCNQDIQPSPEACDGVDNNCNGATDEGNPGGNIACMTGLPGACAAGTTTCTTGSIVCNPITQPVSEACDGVDNNCNGTTDEGNPGGGMVCNTANPGVCAAGTTACMNGSIQCNQNVQPSPETCDGLDNNCNGTTDEGNPGGGMACNTGNPGVCAAGTTSCTNGMVVCNQNAQPSLEVCDGVDNNCDGATDDVNSTGSTGTCDHNKCVTGTLLDPTCNPCVAVICAADPYCCNNNWDSLCVDEVLTECNIECTGPCDTGQSGVCAAGSEVCTNGTLSCVQNVPSSMEICDALDNDCNGQVDNGVPGVGVSCTTGLPGVCTAGITACDSLGMIVCNPLTPPSADVCGDGLDNNCDGQADSFCNCAHSGCVTGPVLTLGCDPCVDQICAVDAFCCNNNWDSACVSEVTTVCNLVCP